MTPFGIPAPTERRTAARRRTDDEADNGNDAGTGGWTSLKSWAHAIGVVGIPGAIAIFLVYLGGTRIPELERKILTLESQQGHIIHNQEQLIVKIDTLIRVSLRACSNAAKDDTARQRCFDP